MGPSPRDRISRPSEQRNAPAFVQVCDRCRWKKIKCDGARPCSNCRNANFPCETRARLSKQATPRSYVQYLEARVRQLEGRRDTEWSPQESSTKPSPYGDRRTQSSARSSDSTEQRRIPDWTVLGELGTQVLDEDGLSRHMGPSSGVGFATKALHDILSNDEMPSDADYYSLFALDDFTRGRALEEADSQLWSIDPTQLPPRDVTDRLVDLFFIYTERIFPVLHRPTFLHAVDRLYSLESIDLKVHAELAQLYLVLSIAYCYVPRTEQEYRVSHQIRTLQTAVKCIFTTPHTRRDGLTQLQTLTLYSYALVLLRQRGKAIEISAMANTKALECGLHHDGNQFHGNPLETEMRRRVFWCTFMLHLLNSSLAGHPRSLHAVDITIAEPSDVDDDQLTTTEILNAIPGRTKIHRFVSVVRLVRILSRTLDVLYTHRKRKPASNRIEQMNRLCCEHLLDQLEFSFEETPDDLPEPNSDDPADLAILASYANEQTLYHYIRWVVHRPGLTLQMTDPQFASCLQTATEAASAILRTVDRYKSVCRFVSMNAAIHPCAIFIAALTPLYRAWLMRTTSANTFTNTNASAAMLHPSSANNAGIQPLMPATSASADEEMDVDACRCAIRMLANTATDHSDAVRRRILQTLVSRVFGEDHEELSRLETIQSNRMTIRPSFSRSVSLMSAPKIEGGMSNNSGGQQQQGEGQGQYDASMEMMDFREHQLEHYAAHEDLRSFVHEAFSPGLSGQWPDDPYSL